MNKKSIAGLFIFSCLVMASLVYGAFIITDSGNAASSEHSRSIGNNNEEGDNSLDTDTDNKVFAENSPKVLAAEQEVDTNVNTEDNNTFINKVNDTTSIIEDNTAAINIDNDSTIAPEVINETNNTEEAITEEPAKDVFSSLIESGAILEREGYKLIVDSTQVDYRSYIPETVMTEELEEALNINNPDINIKAESAILFDANTMEVLYHKNPVTPVFPASTAKLLTALVVLDWCGLDERVLIGNEIRLIARDSTRADIAPRQILTIRNLLEGMLLPSGNDAAYSLAAYVGRKVLNQQMARREDAVNKFVFLMNEKAKQLGVLNSSFKTPDGYDAIGQYTTAYDMGLISLAAIRNETILEICKKSSSRNRFVTGEVVVWKNTNALVRTDNARYYSPCIGLKTGTSTMAGKSLAAAGYYNGKEVICVVYNSSSTGRWTDARSLLDYGLR